MNRSTVIWLVAILALGLLFWVGLPLLSNRPDPAPQEPTQAPTTAAGQVGGQLGPAPAFELTDQNGNAFASSELEEHVWIVNFIFTRCASTCPIQTQRMRELQLVLQDSPVEDEVHFLSITVDPEYDTPAVLTSYAENVSADLDHWSFLTGSRETIWQLCKDFHLAVADDPSNAAMPIAHDSKFILVDRNGQIRGYFDALTAEGLTGLQRTLDFVLPEMPTKQVAALASDTYDASSRTHLAQPPEIIHNHWIEKRVETEAAALADSNVFHNFGFDNTLDDSGIDFDPAIVDEQRWRLQVNHYDHGNGIAIADIDGDQLLDVYFVSQVGANGLYRNLGGGKFKNITQQAGVSLTDRVGVSASFADIDNDGDADLFVTTVRDGNALFENDGSGKFSDISQAAGVDYVGHSSAAVFFDYDRDGLLDLFVTNVGKYSTDERVKVRLDGTSPISTGDFEYYLGTKDAFAGHLKPEQTEASILYHNLGDNRFEDVSQAMQLVDTRWSGAATPMDLNEDGWQDLYVLNMQGKDEYYENIQGQRFEAKGSQVFPQTSWGSMGVKWFDFNNDAKFDLYITDMHSDMSEDVDWTQEAKKSNMQWPPPFLQSTAAESIFGNSFYLNQGDQSFKEVSDQIGAENYWPWGLSTGDLNADGFEDAFVTASMCLPYRYSMNSVFLNEAGKRFVASECALGVEPRPQDERIKPWFELDCDGADRGNPICAGRTGQLTVWSALGSRSSAIFDFDSDGDLDVITSDFGSRPQVFTSNLSEQVDALQFLQVQLQGTQSNRDALGAIVHVFTADGVQRSKANDGQSGYLSQSRMPLYFGLGGNSEVQRIEIQWPSGKQQVVEGPIEANQTLIVEEQAE